MLYDSFNKEVRDSGLPVADVALGSSGEEGRPHGGVPPVSPGTFHLVASAGKAWWALLCPAPPASVEGL